MSKPFGRAEPFRNRRPKLVKRLLCAAAAAAWLIVPAKAQPEAKEVRIAFQYGIAYLPLLVAEDRQFIEQHLQAAGLKDTKVSLVRFSGAPAVSEAVLSGNVDIGAYGTTGFLTAWDKTRGNIGLKGLCGIAVMQSVLLANRPDIRSIRDFKPEDRISVPATIAPQAVILRMAAEQAFGPGQYGRLDPQMVVLPHPDGLRALVNRVDVAAQVTSPPFDSLALQDKSIHRVLTSDDVLGGPSTFVLLATTEKFATANPRTTQAVLAAMEEAIAYIEAHRRDASEIYVKADRSSLKPEFIEGLLQDSANRFSIEPLRMMRYAEFMARTGSLRQAPRDWKELFLPLIGNRSGS
jgi:NitT/TauT family transport system substrate-binding protein